MNTTDTKKIQILYEFPIIFTKDESFLSGDVVAQPGEIILLPQDAVLCLPPTTPVMDGEKG